MRFEIEFMRGGYSVFKVTESGRRIFANAFESLSEAQEAYPTAVAVGSAALESRERLDKRVVDPL